MKNITDENVEEWIFDYLEKNISIEQEQILLNKINSNIQYKELLNTWRSTYLIDNVQIPDNLSDQFLRTNEIVKENDVPKNSFFNNIKFVYLSVGLAVISGIALVYFINKKNNQPVVIKTEYKIIDDSTSSNLVKSSKNEVQNNKQTNKYNNKSYHKNDLNNIKVVDNKIVVKENHIDEKYDSIPKAKIVESEPLHEVKQNVAPIQVQEDRKLGTPIPADDSKNRKLKKKVKAEIAPLSDQNW